MTPRLPPLALALITALAAWAPLTATAKPRLAQLTATAKPGHAARTATAKPRRAKLTARPRRAPFRAGNGSHVRFPPDWEKYPSARYGAMSGDDCVAELSRRGVEFTRAGDAPGVVTPLRLPKDVGGVVYRTEAPDHVRAAAPYDIFDCRLVLALSDFSAVLRAHDVDEVRMFSAYRPEKIFNDGAASGPKPRAPAEPLHEGEGATRHAGGLAMDARRFGKHRGTEQVWLEVERDFHSTIGAQACGPGAAPPMPSTPEARELRSIACEAADQHLFTSILTPAYDRAHRNHLHLEVTPAVRWTLVR